MPATRPMMAALSRQASFYEHAMAVHIQSSSLSGFLSAIVENMVSSRANDATLEVRVSYLLRARQERRILNLEVTP